MGKLQNLSSSLLVSMVVLMPTIALAEGRMSIVTRIQGFGVSMATVSTVPLGEAKVPPVIIDRQLQSPKSARFSADGKKLYINSLESFRTLVYEWPTLKKIKSVSYIFGAEHAGLFYGETTNWNYQYLATPAHGQVNEFHGRPVESELSHNGQFLWVPFYRRSFDEFGMSPGAMAIIDTRTDSIVRVVPTGPIPKYVAVSPDGKTLAVIHWGDNTIGLFDISSKDPKDFRPIGHLVVERQVPAVSKAGKDPDRFCDFCLRGAVFSPDSQILVVARMGGGGLAAFDISSQRYLGSLMNVPETPRHLVSDLRRGELILSANVSGRIARLSWSEVIHAFMKAEGRRISGPRNWQVLEVGAGARTLSLSNDGRSYFVAVNRSSELVRVDVSSFQIVDRIKVPDFAVGLALSPDGKTAITTSQGRSGEGGGHVVTVIRTP